VRLFTRQQRGDGPIVSGERQLFCNLFWGKVPTVPAHNAWDDPRVHRQATGFGIEDVAAFITDDRFPRLCVQATGNGIGHGCGGQEDAGLLAEQSGDLCL
jgi:hypothetical protein